MPRPVLQTCGKLRVEVRPLTLQAFKWPDYDKAKPLQISRRVRYPRSTLIAVPEALLTAAMKAGSSHEWLVSILYSTTIRIQTVNPMQRAIERASKHVCKVR